MIKNIFHFSFILIFSICEGQKVSLSEKILDENNLNIGSISHSLQQFGLNHKNSLKFSYNNSFIINSGHRNLDNSAEIFVPGKSSYFHSFRFSLRYPWLLVDLEPFLIQHSNLFQTPSVSSPYNFSNHSGAKTDFAEKGLRQSQIILHYRGFGIGYGKINQWWGPGFHSAITLSSNPPSQETFSFGTFEEFKFKNYGFYAKVIGMPYKNRFGHQVYFSGLKSKLTFYSNPIISIGINRAYYSGIFPGYRVQSWNFNDAINLVFEPLFGQSKKDLTYTDEGTQGFDDWDEILTITLKVIFPSDKIEFYLDIGSDDNRANFTDLRAHWDHTLGYQIGAIKEIDFKNNQLLLGIEKTSTRESNSFKSSFFRANPNALNFYAKGIYDFSTFQGRFMGAHSGSSSTDLILLFGLMNEKYSLIMSFNREKSGIKVKEYPEKKNEFAFLYKYALSKSHSFYFKCEYETIDNFSFMNEKISTSRLFLLGYTFSFIK